jgi:hypothetical protein
MSSPDGPELDPAVVIAQLDLEDLPTSALEAAMRFLSLEARQGCLRLLCREKDSWLALLFSPDQRRLSGWCAMAVRDIAGEGRWQELLYALLELHLARAIPADYTSVAAERAAAQAALAGEHHTAAGFAARAAYEAWANRWSVEAEARFATLAIACTNDFERLGRFVLTLEARLRAQHEHHP